MGDALLDALLNAVKLRTHELAKVKVEELEQEKMAREPQYLSGLSDLGNSHNRAAKVKRTADEWAAELDQHDPATIAAAIALVITQPRWKYRDLLVLHTSVNKVLWEKFKEENR